MQGGRILAMDESREVATSLGPNEAHPAARHEYIVVVDPVAHFFRYCTAARTRGLGVIVLSASADVCRAEQAGYAAMVDDFPENPVDVFLTYEADDDVSALAALDPYRHLIQGLVAGDEVTVASTARLGRDLGFAYTAPEDARCCQIKSYMKQRLIERGVRTPRFVAVTTLTDGLAAWERFGSDAMLKMVDYAMSLGVFRVTSREEFEYAWRTIERNRLLLDHGFATDNTVLVEEFIGGREFSVEGYVRGATVEILNFCEKLTHANFMVTGHYIPARVNGDEEQLLSDIARACVVALGLRNSVFHAEVHIFNGEAYVIECAARPPGQYSVAVIKRVYGFDLMELNIDLACGLDTDVRRGAPRCWSAIMALYSDKSGIVKDVEGLNALRDRPECYAAKCTVKPGDAVHRLETFRDVLGLAFLEAPDFETVRDAFAWARSMDQFRV
jgi:biotin carboxylase